MAYEIVDVLKFKDIPLNLQVEKIAQLLKMSGVGPVWLDQIRPIVVRSHIAKIIEKAILGKMKYVVPKLLALQIIKTGFM